MTLSPDEHAIYFVFYCLSDGMQAPGRTGFYLTHCGCPVTIFKGRKEGMNGREWFRCAWVSSPGSRGLLTMYQTGRQGILREDTLQTVGCTCWSLDRCPGPAPGKASQTAEHADVGRLVSHTACLATFLLLSVRACYILTESLSPELQI